MDCIIDPNNLGRVDLHWEVVELFNSWDYKKLSMEKIMKFKIDRSKNCFLRQGDDEL